MRSDRPKCGVVLGDRDVAAVLAGAKTVMRFPIPADGSPWVRVPAFIPSDLPPQIADASVKPGRYAAVLNPQGAVSVLVKGVPIGVKPVEFEWDCPFGRPGQSVWVQEDWQQLVLDDVKLVAFRATCPGNAFDYVDAGGGIQRIEVSRWRAASTMPRWASRLTLNVLGVGVQRLHAIDDADAKREGAAWRIAPGGDLAGAFEGTGAPIGYRNHYRERWEADHGEGSWRGNPLVWRVEFRRAEVSDAH